MARLILVKHSMPEIDPDVPAKLWRLSPEGKARCDWLAAELSKFQPHSLYSSVEAKAEETAALVGTKLGLKAQAVEGLHENDRTGFPYIHDTKLFEQQLREFFDNPVDRLIGDETANEARERFHEAIIQIIEETQGRTACVIAHGAVISLFVSHFNTISAFAMWCALNPLPAYVVLDLTDFRITDSAMCYPGEE